MPLRERPTQGVSTVCLELPLRIWLTTNPIEEPKCGDGLSAAPRKRRKRCSKRSCMRFEETRGLLCLCEDHCTVAGVGLLRHVGEVPKQQDGRCFARGRRG